MPARQRLQIEQSEERQRINELLAIEPGKMTDEQRAEVQGLLTRVSLGDYLAQAAPPGQGRQ